MNAADLAVNRTSDAVVPDHFPLDFRVVSTILHIAVFLVGVIGNLVLIWVARKSKTLRTPTYCYLVSLAYADLLVIIAAVPEAVLYHNLGGRWLFGEIGCAVFIFTNFLGINAGSLSILAFTVERYIAICRPFYAQKHCTLQKTRKVIVWIWIAAILYCSPWLGLTEVKADDWNPDNKQCSFRVPGSVYLIIFALDLVLFYIIPLLAAVVIYSKIGLILYKSIQRFNPDFCPSGSITSANQIPFRKNSDEADEPGSTVLFDRRTLEKGAAQVSFRQHGDRRQMLANIRSRAQVLQMLAVVVILFAVSWLPFRGLLVYNTFVEQPWLDIWYLLFAKTLIYMNSAINPLLYNWMSPRFRMAVNEVLFPKQQKGSQHEGGVTVKEERKEIMSVIKPAAKAENSITSLPDKFATC